MAGNNPYYSNYNNVYSQFLNQQQQPQNAAAPGTAAPTNNAGYAAPSQTPQVGVGGYVVDQNQYYNNQGHGQQQATGAPTNNGMIYQQQQQQQQQPPPNNNSYGTTTASTTSSYNNSYDPTSYNATPSGYPTTSMPQQQQQQHHYQQQQQPASTAPNSGYTMSHHHQQQQQYSNNPSAPPPTSYTSWGVGGATATTSSSGIPNPLVSNYGNNQHQPLTTPAAVPPAALSGMAVHQTSSYGNSQYGSSRGTAPVGYSTAPSMSYQTNGQHGSYSSSSQQPQTAAVPPTMNNQFDYNGGHQQYSSAAAAPAINAGGIASSNYGGNQSQQSGHVMGIYNHGATTTTTMSSSSYNPTTSLSAAQAQGAPGYSMPSQPLGQTATANSLMSLASSQLSQSSAAPAGPSSATGIGQVSAAAMKGKNMPKSYDLHPPPGAILANNDRRNNTMIATNYAMMGASAHTSAFSTAPPTKKKTKKVVSAAVKAAAAPASASKTSAASIKAAAAIASGSSRANNAASSSKSPASKAAIMKNLYQQRGQSTAAKAQPSTKQAPVKTPAKPTVDMTSTDYLRSLLTKKNKQSDSPNTSLVTPHKQQPARSRPAVNVSPKEIVIPALFSPSHSYRATAAYSLLRTLSKELRLSPFTLQSFLTSLMLPIPSKLLGEIHVRVIRILYANIGWGSYAKLGEGDVSKISRRGSGGGSLGKKRNVFGRKTKKKVHGVLEEEEIEEEELITKRGGDNLYFLDPTTWPLFFEDYAVAAEEKFLDVTELPSIDLDDTENGMEDDDRMEFINIRSSAMLPLEDIDLNPTSVPRRVGSVIGANDARPDYENRCPAGPLGYRNAVGRFVCCPFHIATAVQMFHKMVPGAATPAKSLSVSQPSTAGKKKGRPAKKKKGGKPQKKGSAKKTNSSRRSSKKVSYTEGSSSSSSDEYSDNDSDDDYPSPAKKCKTESTDLSMTVKLSSQHQQTPAMNTKSVQQNMSPSSAIRGSRVLDVQFSNTAKAVIPPPTAVSGGSSNLNQPIPAATVKSVSKPSQVTNESDGLVQANSTQPSQLPKAQTNTADLTQPEGVVDLTQSPAGASKPVPTVEPTAERAKAEQLPEPMEVSTKPNPPSNNYQEQNKEPLFKVGTVVQVQDRMWARVNKPGGVARIMKIYLAVPGEVCKDGDQEMTKYDVKFILGGREKGVKERFISLHSDYVTGEAVDQPPSELQSVVQPPQPPTKMQSQVSASGKQANASHHPPQCRGPIPIHRPHMNTQVPHPAMTNHHMQPQPLQQAFPPIVVAPVAVPPVDPDALLVSDGVETSLKHFFTSPPTKKGGDTMGVIKAEGSPLEVIQSPSDTTTISNSDNDLMAHMAPMRRIQQGTPYHHLDLNSKLSVLEFLLDELLLVQEISNEMARRQLSTDMMKEPYGNMPAEKEYEDMYNADECLICELEGDLLCCDGCPSSVHKACIGMAPQGRLPEGKWLCTECRIVDASKPGPLGSESRPLIGWFTLGDIESVHSQDSIMVHSQQVHAAVLANAAQPTMTMPMPSPGSNPSQFPNGNSLVMPNAMVIASQPAAQSSVPMPGSGFSGVNPVQQPNAVSAAMSNSMNTHAVQQIQPQGTKQSLSHAPSDVDSGEVVSSSGLVSMAQPGFMTNDTQMIQPQAPSRTLSEGQPFPPSNVQVLTHQQMHAIAAAKKCKIPDNVEFLATSGMVFARYKSTLEPFDPFNLPDKSSPQPAIARDSAMKTLSPPVPLSARQLEEVLKLLGPKVCMSLPWHRIPFNPQRTFAGIKSAATLENCMPQYIQQLLKAQEVADLGTLVTHQEDTRKYLSNHSEWNNPMVYINSYRKAPPVQMVKSHQGHFFYPSNVFPDINNYPTKTSALAVTLTDLTVDRQGHSLKITFVDPMKSIRDKMTRLEWSLNGACLLDMRWGVLDHYFIGDDWKQKVERANSIKDLATLLIKLIDACCLKVFVPEWYKQKENSDEESGRLSPVSDINESSFISDDWNPKQEQIKRKWDRCKGNEILRLFNGFLEEVFNREVPPKNGWKLRKPRDGGNTVAKKSGNKSTSDQSMAKQKHSTEEDKAKLTPLSSEKGQPNNENDRTVLNGSTSESILANDGTEQTTKVEPQLPSNPNPTSLTSGKTQVDVSSSSTSNALTEDHIAVDPSPHESMSLSPNRKKFHSCGKCENCLQQDCRECASCADMKKYGGSGKTHQKCLKKKDCVMRASFEESTPAKASKSLTKKSKSSKKKARARRESSAPPNSRRRSERLNIIRQHIETLLGITEDVANCTKIEKAITELKLDKLEQVLVNDYKTAGYWAIAGQMLFEPDGTVPRRLVKWLARNAGSVRAPSISYDTNYEVGETAVCHHWRERTMACCTYESLLHSLRFLDAHLDKAVMMTANNIASRQASSNKSPTTTAVRIVHTDPMTGFNDYFVVPTGKKRGSWYLEEKVDLNALIQYRSVRRRPWLEKKDQFERERKQRETLLSAAKKKEAVSVSKNKRKAPASSVKSNPPTKKAKNASLIKQKQNDFQATVNEHRGDTLRLLKTSAAKGEASVPANLMAQSRMANLSKMKAANMAVKCCGGKKLSDKELSARLAKAESDAVQLYISEIHQAKRGTTQSQTGSNSQTKQAAKPQPVKPKAQPGLLTAKTKPSTAASLSSTQPPPSTHQPPAAAQVSARSANSSLQPSSAQPRQLIVQSSANSSLQPASHPTATPQSTSQAQMPSQTQPKHTHLPSSNTASASNSILDSNSAPVPAASSDQPSKTATGIANSSKCAAPGSLNFERESSTVSATSSLSPHQLSSCQPQQANSQPQQLSSAATQSVASSLGSAMQHQTNSSAAQKPEKKVVPIYDI